VTERLRIGTRKSELARWQADHVADALRRAWGGALEVERVEITTEGDRRLDVPLADLGGKGLFVREIEERLLAGDIDLAVHSMKDLPGRLPGGLRLGPTPRREDARDVLVTRAARSLAELPAGARVGTSSLRRAALVRRLHPGLELVPLRGNVPTRLARLDAGDVDAVVLAGAGLIRLGRADVVREWLAPAQFCPAACQGILALELRESDPRVAAFCAPLSDPATEPVAAAERAFLARLDGGCRVPIGCHAVLEGDRLDVLGVVADPSADPWFSARASGPAADAARLGVEVAGALLELGAGAVLGRA
jgi:hydroxymethylbilane synthase